MNRATKLFIGCFQQIAILLILAVYFVFASHPTAWPGTFIWWPWAAYAVFLDLNHFFDGVQNTARNIARIYLLERDGTGYSIELFEFLRDAIVPDFLSFRFALWFGSHLASFTLILFFQGWATAMLAEAFLFVPLEIRPLRYQRHLSDTYRHLLRMRAVQHVSLMVAGVDLADLRTLVSQAIDEDRDPQQWWGEVFARTRRQELMALLPSPPPH